MHFFGIFFILILLIMALFAIGIAALVHMAKVDKRDRDAQELIFKARHPYYRRRRDR
jgi:hypothetical protein